MYVSEPFLASLRRLKGKLVMGGGKSLDPVVESLAATQLGFLSEDYLPWSASAISRQVAVRLCNELAVNQRRFIVEFGPGISTLVMARWAETSRVPISILGVEESLEWLHYLQSRLEGMSLSFARVRLIHAPLRAATGSYPVPVRRWYDLAVDDLGPDPFDLVLVDGPSAYLRDNRFDRYPALSAVRPLLSEDCVVVLDDSDRRGEAEVVRTWSRELHDEQWMLTRCGGAAWWTRGRAFTT